MMKINNKKYKAPMMLLSAVSAAFLTCTVNATELTAWALLPANTFAVGPTSGQFAGSGNGGNALPLVDKQPVQGVSGVLQGPTGSTFYVMPDNGFGTKPNSVDTLLRVYAIKPNFKTWNGHSVTGKGSISPAHFYNGRVLPSFTKDSFISLRDPGKKIGFPLVADQEKYPSTDPAKTIKVDESITAKRFLTGGDFDIESFRKDRKGHLWFGEEFGPFLVETDMSGKVLRTEVRTPNNIPPGSTSSPDVKEVRSPQNPYLGTDTPNLSQSRGFEGMAINPKGDKLYPLLEGTVLGDNDINGTVNKNLRISEYDIKKGRYTGNNWLYQLEADGVAIGDMTAINDHQFLVIERNNATATSVAPQPAPFKKIFLIDINDVDNGSFVHKTELVDLMNIADPHDLNGDGSHLFTFPFVTIESVLPLNPKTLLVINDNNYPGVGGRDLNSDNSEFIKIKLDKALDLDHDKDDDYRQY